MPENTMPNFTVNIKTSELQGPALDWAVAVALEREYGEGRVVKVCRLEATFPAWIERENSPGSAPYYHRFSPSTDWSQGGPLIERERICVGDSIHPDDNWTATIYVPDEEPWQLDGPTPLIAAMRCLVAAKLGDTVEVPEGLL